MFSLGWVLLGCDRDEREDRVAPWRAVEAATDGATERSPLALTVSGDSKLSFSLPAPKATPRGELAGIEGTVDTDLFDLAQTSGALLFPFDRLRMASEGLGADEERTREALRWLGIGAMARAPETHRRARLEVSSLRKVRPLRPHQGEAIADPSSAGLLGRRVRAEALGHLVIRGFGVDVELPVSLDFFYRTLEGAPPTPTKVVARLEGPLRVHLAEHEIAPRDESGVTDQSALELLGSAVGKTALVEGTLELFPTVR